MNEMTLSSRHRFRISSPGGLRPSTLPTILSFTRGWGRNIFVSFKTPRPGTEPRTLAWKAAVLTTIPGPPPLLLHDMWGSRCCMVIWDTVILWGCEWLLLHDHDDIYKCMKKCLYGHLVMWGKVVVWGRQEIIAVRVNHEHNLPTESD